MRGLFAKIFLGFWIAQSLTFLISTVLILRRQFVRPNEVMGVLDSTLPNAATAAANAYEAGGCAGSRTIRRIASPDHLSRRHPHALSLPSQSAPRRGERFGQAAHGCPGGSLHPDR